MLLKAHLDAVETSLSAISRVPANSGHSLHKGTPREAFIKEFLSNHLSERAAIGKGEVIDATSQPNQQRNQIDIVLYKREYPKLHLGADIDAFLIESLISTIEVKSLLAKEDLEQAVCAAHSVKSLRQTPFA